MFLTQQFSRMNSTQHKALPITFTDLKAIKLEVLKSYKRTLPSKYIQNQSRDDYQINPNTDKKKYKICLLLCEI